MRVFALAASAAFVGLVISGGAGLLSSASVAARVAPLGASNEGNSMSPPLKYTSRAQIRSKFIQQDFSPDGDLTKPAWKKAEWRKFDHDMSGKVRYPQAETRVASLGSARSVWRANFFRADGPGGDAQRRFMSWSAIPEGKSFHVPTRFGRLRFVR